MSLLCFRFFPRPEVLCGPYPLPLRQIKKIRSPGTILPLLHPLFIYAIMSADPYACAETHLCA